MPALNTPFTLNRQLGGNSTSASDGTSEYCVMSLARPVVSYMVNSVRTPELPQNCSLCSTDKSHVQELN